MDGSDFGGNWVGIRDLINFGSCVSHVFVFVFLSALWPENVVVIGACKALLEPGLVANATE